MSSRERWIVYPILFMTLGIALRDKIVPRTDLRLNSIVCNRIEANQAECRAVRANAVACEQFESKSTECQTLLSKAVACEQFETNRVECRSLLVKGQSGPIVVAGMDAQSRGGVVETFSAKGLPQVQLLATDGGGLVAARGSTGNVMLLLGHLGQKFANNFGLFLQKPDLAAPVPLIQPLRIETKPAATEKSQSSPESQKTK